MKWSLFFLVFLLFSSCGKDKVHCGSDEIQYGDLSCIPKETYTFYEAKVNFYCLDVSLLFAVDINQKRIAPYFINTHNPVHSPIMTNIGDIFYLSNPLYYATFAIGCTISDQYMVTRVWLDDTEQLNTYPSVIKAKLLLKESIDFYSPTLDEMEIELRRRD